MLLLIFHIYQAAIIKPKIIQFASIILKINQINCFLDQKIEVYHDKNLAIKGLKKKKKNPYHLICMVRAKVALHNKKKKILEIIIHNVFMP